jgi:hypothetical protein
MRASPFALLALLPAFFASVAHAQLVTYQGELLVGGSPANGNYQMQFSVFPTLTGGTAITTAPALIANVADGRFTERPLFAANAFTGSAAFIEIGVRPAGSTDPYTILSPRQRVTATPTAIRSLNERWSPLNANTIATDAGVSNVLINTSAEPAADSVLTVSNDSLSTATTAGMYVNARGAGSLSYYGWAVDGVSKGEARVSGADGEFRLSLNEGIRMRMSADGLVGLGMLPGATERLKVAGDVTATGVVKAADFAYETPKTQYLSVQAHAFVPSGTSATVMRRDTDRVGFDSSVVLGALYAPVSLPHGATITGLTFYCIDNVPEFIQVSLQAAEHTSGGTVTYALVNSTGASSQYRGFSAVGFVPRVVDNLNNSYLLTVACDDWNTTPNTSLKSVVLSYTMPSPQ